MTTNRQENDLGQEAYGRNIASHTTVELLKNLESQPIQRLRKGTEEYAGTALAVVELPTREGLGLQIEMDSDSETVTVYSDITVTESGLSASESERIDYSVLERLCRRCHIQEVAHSSIMDPESAEAFFVLNAQARKSPLAVNLHLDDGGLNFFSSDL